MEGGARGPGPTPARWDSPVGPAAEVEVRPGRPWSRGLRPQSRRPRRAGPRGGLRERGRGRLGLARCRGRWDRPALATGSPWWFRRSSLSNWREKGPDFPKSLMHLLLSPDSSPGTAGDAPQREVSTAGQLEAGCSNSCGVHSSDLLVCERPGL